MSDQEKSVSSSAELFGKAFWEAVDIQIEESLKREHENKISLELKFPPQTIEQIITRPISRQEVDYQLRCYAYLELCNADQLSDLPSGKPNALIRSVSGWLIHDYGNFLCSSPGKLRYGYHPEANDGLAINDGVYKPDDEENLDISIPKKTGTIVQQFVDTAKDMVALAKDRWPAAHIVSGWYAMQRAAWIIGLLNEYLIQGFDATPEDNVVLYWANKYGNKRLSITDISRLKARIREQLDNPKL